MVLLKLAFGRLFLCPIFGNSMVEFEKLVDKVYFFFLNTVLMSHLGRNMAPRIKYG